MTSGTSGTETAGTPTPRPAPPAPPPSCANGWITGFGFLCLCISVALLHDAALSDAQKAIIWALSATGPVLLLDVLVLKAHRRPSSGLDWDRSPDFDPGRVSVKLLGFAATIGTIAAVYWVAPEYHGSFYDPFWRMAHEFGPWLALAAVPYFVVVDSRMRDPCDAYWDLGRLVLGQTRGTDWRRLGNHARGWAVKGFFLPLMFTYLASQMASVATGIANQTWESFLSAYDLLYQATFAVDLVFAAAGYILTFRLTDTHIRTAEPTLLGWGVAVMCYQPFWSLISGQYLTYGTDYYWDQWLIGFPAFRVVWGCTILMLLTFYAWATVSFGARFSNLTHRGILTNGPYRLSKHPAYLSKNLSWWMISIPFVPVEGWDLAIRHCAALAVVNLIYFARARTEERHLSADPTYVAYALWINEHGALAWVGRLVPWLRYRPPAGAPSPEAAALYGVSVEGGGQVSGSAGR